MNIKKAKQEIINTARAYLQKNMDGSYRIPLLRQRPVLLMGPPGIGKTQIMEQIAAETGLGLVAYTITHHTRQSAIGLPYIIEKDYNGRTYSVTRYTMSEIIASVYDQMEETGKKEGILFIDEINCISETLAPTMLQFLQAKQFGNHHVPEGWIIVAAGNPPQYNKSVREFDVVTLDRIKVIPVEADFEVWKEYAYKSGIHGSIISYLEIHRENFYRMETAAEGLRFVTPRGWEDLSELIYVYEDLKLDTDHEVAQEYLQFPAVASDFANYYELFRKYRDDYRIDEILSGRIRPGTLNKLKFASFDERYEVVGLLLSRLFGDLKKMQEETQKGTQEEAQSQEEAQTRKDITEQEKAQTRKKIAEQVEAQERIEISEEISEQEDPVTQMAQKLEYAFDFMEAAFGESQEMVIFITELSANPRSAAFLREYDCDRYYMYNKSLLFADREAEIRNSLDEIRNMQIT